MERIQELEVTKEGLITELAKLKRTMGILDPNSSAFDTSRFGPSDVHERSNVGESRGGRRSPIMSGDGGSPSSYVITSSSSPGTVQGGLVGRDERARRIQDAEEMAYLVC
jgi:hypothetical protein